MRESSLLICLRKNTKSFLNPVNFGPQPLVWVFAWKKKSKKENKDGRTEKMVIKTRALSFFFFFFFDFFRLYHPTQRIEEGWVAKSVPVRDRFWSKIMDFPWPPLLSFSFSFLHPSAKGKNLNNKKEEIRTRCSVLCFVYSFFCQTKWWDLYLGLGETKKKKIQNQKRGGENSSRLSRLISSLLPIIFKRR